MATGFYVLGASSPAVESDGRAGTVEIAAALMVTGGDAWLVSDEYRAPVVSVTVRDDVSDDHVFVSSRGAGFDVWLDSARRLVARRGIDSLVYIERVGPSHDDALGNIRGVDVSRAPLSRLAELGLTIVGIGDGDNEIGVSCIDFLPI